MKKRLFLLFTAMAVTGALLSQTPQAFNYQGIARDGSGVPLSLQSISVKLSIISGSPSGSAEYIEVHNVATNEFGMHF